LTSGLIYDTAPVLLLTIDLSMKLLVFLDWQRKEVGLAITVVLGEVVSLCKVGAEDNMVAVVVGVIGINPIYLKDSCPISLIPFFGV